MVTVLPDPSGIAQGIQTAGGALERALQQRAQNRLVAQKQAFQQEQQAQQQAQQQQEQEQKRSEFENLLIGLETQGGEIGALSTVLREAGVGPDMAMPILQKQITQSQKATGTGSTVQERDTYKTNQQLITGVSHDARKAKSLLRESDKLIKAIESKNIPGRGIIGSIWETGQDLFNIAPSEVQLMKSLAKRSIIDMGDTKGIRLTDTKLKFLEDNLWNPRKSLSENKEAYDLWKQMMEEYVGYEQTLSEVLKDDPNAMGDPSLSIRISEGAYKPTETEPVQVKTVEKPNKENAKQLKGKILRNEKTGERVIEHNGRWVKYKG